MISKYRKIYTCTPVAFHANDGFFIRDSGLIASTLRTLGIDSRCIMPLPYYDDDQREHLIRTEYSNLTSPEWWKSTGIDALILYSWASPKFIPVARAIRKSGIKLIIHLDTSGYFDGADWNKLNLLQKICRKTKTKLVDFLRAIHLKYAHVITVSLPTAEMIGKRLFFGKWFRDKVFYTPCPVAPNFFYDSSIIRERRVICVGRWSESDGDAVKRPEFMIQTAKAIVTSDDTVQVDIYGRIGARVQALYDSFSYDVQKRINLKGAVKNHDLPPVYNSSMVSICTSRSEGTHIASCEALCCGCSLVIPPRKSLHVLHWYTSENSGTIADEDTPESMAKAVIKELELWNKKERTPKDISEHWANCFHADKVMKGIFESKKI